jgi:hypothetical protein
VEDPERIYLSGVTFRKWRLTFLSRERKVRQKKAPVSRLILRVVAAAGARENSSACGGLKQSARFDPATPPMLGAGQRD